ncbi:hypothetical protein FSP39_008940 [Pinctada imbricata]|uniref:G-protein coupled receptors family 2 profile 2 domain-containing protein n=1 Tax=Pinctada imbricata TaxID=66713 RepID=A0AA88YUW7_PINIB|nr:hypothetical protein FSP39_008940 [Pinctada imbricata]
MPTPNERKRRSVTNDSNLYFSAKVSKILFCPQIELEDDEYNISDSDSSMVLTRIGLQDISSNEFAFTPNGRMRVCLNYLQLINYLPIQQTAVALIEDLKQKYLWIISLVASIISIISLCLGLFIYSAFPSLRTIPGKLLMMMMMSLLLTLIFLQVSFFVVQTKYGCYGVAVVLHFLWISVFTSMQTSNYHMWRTFTSKEIRTKTSTRALIWYGTYCVGVPFILVLLNTVISWIRYSNPFLGYGGGNCFIRDMYLKISLFVCPVGLICLFNIIFFSLTIHAIRTTPSADNNQQKRNELAIFARLATITGLSWLLQIVDSFLPVSYFTFVSTVINSLQGLLIFIAFVVNKRVWNLLSNNDRRKENNKILTPDPKIDSRTVHTKRSNDLSMTTSCASSNSKDVLRVNESTDPIEHSKNQVENNAFKNDSDGNINKLLIHEEETQCESQTKECLVNLSAQTSFMESHSEVREAGNTKSCKTPDDPDIKDSSRRSD